MHDPCILNIFLEYRCILYCITFLNWKNRCNLKFDSIKKGILWLNGLTVVWWWSCCIYRCDFTTCMFWNRRELFELTIKSAGCIRTATLKQDKCTALNFLSSYDRDLELLHSWVHQQNLKGPPRRRTNISYLRSVVSVDFVDFVGSCFLVCSSTSRPKYVIYMHISM